MKGMVITMNIEKMDEFFTSRVDTYDAHMMANVVGCKEGYRKMGEVVAHQYEKLGGQALPLLDLGCGTGLELEEIFRRLPNLEVTGIDLTQAMLDQLAEKFPDQALHLICGSYFDVDFGASAYGCAVSFQTMHHFSHEKKLELYQRICASLRPGGIYVECDYMVETQEEEDLWFGENTRIRLAQNIPPEAFFHYDTPCTIANQISLLQSAGFSTVEQVFRMENTTMLVAKKEERDACISQTALL